MVEVRKIEVPVTLVDPPPATQPVKRPKTTRVDIPPETMERIQKEMEQRRLVNRLDTQTAIMEALEPGVYRVTKERNQISMTRIGD
jgi:hypothetical protein